MAELQRVAEEANAALERERQEVAAAGQRAAEVCASSGKGSLPILWWIKRRKSCIYVFLGPQFLADGFIEHIVGTPLLAWPGFM